MQRLIRNAFYFFVLTSASLTFAMQPVMIEHANGEHYPIEVHKDASFNEVMDCISTNLEAVESGKGPFKKEFVVSISDQKVVVKKANQIQKQPRAYVEPTDNEKGDISTIVTTLANTGLLKLPKLEPSLKKAGDRIDRVHPLQFLGYALSDEKLKVCLRNLKGRSWVWDRFLAGIVQSFNDESALDNIMPYIENFAARINININEILPSVRAEKWVDFVDTVIKKAPRNPNANRINM